MEMDLTGRDVELADISSTLRRASRMYMGWDGKLWLYIDDSDLWITWWEDYWWFQSSCGNGTFQRQQYAPLPSGPPTRPPLPRPTEQQ